ncbi:MULTISPECIES: hypothetical protein [Caryophanaceae]|uniref:DUF4305 domain-containing protein n=1 Tax=Planomicrobium stackebrandtii TaxID=253160 RepID=A0ABU0GPN7_9BACL|nr:MULTISPECIES: hypothetical protein [Planococcaceae]MDQ0427316.1 hypothetical protein [Planomicrobium stackebrandtii]
MKTATILILLIIVMHAITAVNTLVFNGMLADLVFWFNSALFMGALAVYVSRMDKDKRAAEKK